MAPTHCTGDDAQLIFKELYEDDYKYFLSLKQRVDYFNSYQKWNNSHEEIT